VTKSKSIKPVGTYMYLVQLLALTALYIGLVQLKIKLGGRIPPYVLDVVCVIPFVLWIQSIEGRLVDAGLPRWYRWPYVVILVFGCSLLYGFKIVDGPQSLLLFVLLQILTIFIRSKPAPINESSDEKIADSSRRLAALGGTMPELEAIPRRRME
jgi:hypothetical protein